MLLRDFHPRSQLIVKTTLIQKPRFPVIDAHNHLGAPFGEGWEKRPLSELLDLLEEAGVVHYIDLDGAWSEDTLHRHLDYFVSGAPERFTVFGGVDWNQWREKGNVFPDWAANSLRRQVARGARGLKIWKAFGLHVRDHKGQLVNVDDSRLDPIWETAAELNLPVVIHVADPPAFFAPLDEHNERWEELQEHPDWAFTSPPYPSFLSIMEAFYRLVRNHPRTTFIGAHVGGYAENLAWVGKMLEDCPNYYIDTSARLGELGRQPYTARRFFLKYADRILFGSDLGPEPESYRLFYRFLETDDEYFNYSVGEIPLQGRWYAYGIFLPDEVLERVYFRNAEMILHKNG